MHGRAGRKQQGLVPLAVAVRGGRGNGAVMIKTNSLPTTIRAAATELVPNLAGGYRFLPGLPFASAAALACDGFDIVRATFRRPRPYPEGLDEIEQYLQRLNRPLQALCGLELRSAHTYSREAFIAFNQSYVERMREQAVLVGSRVPFTRTNVVITGTRAAQTVHAFCYTVPTSSGMSTRVPTFVLAAVPEIRFASSERGDEVIALGDTSTEGRRRKIAFVLEVLTERLRALHVGWSNVTGAQVYSLYDGRSAVLEAVSSKLQVASGCIQLIFARPPVDYVNIEIDVRSTQAEVIIDE